MDRLLKASEILYNKHPLYAGMKMIVFGSAGNLSDF